MNESQVTSRDQGEAPKDERLGVITGVRICAKCGFNLMGQTILREPIYSLIVARCPECGQVAPLQEYPSNARLARHWTMFLSALLILLILGFGMGVSLSMMGFMFVVLDEGTDLLTFTIRAGDWSVPTDTASIESWRRLSENTLAAAWPDIAAPLTGGAVFAIIGGLFVSITMLRLRWLLLAVGAWTLLAAPIIGWAIQWAYVTMHVNGQLTISARDMAHYLLGPRLALLTILIYAVCTAGAALLGRPIVRRLVLLLLPAPMRAGLAPLWLTDGKELPKGRGW